MATAPVPDPAPPAPGLSVTPDAYDTLVERVGHFTASAFVTLALDAAPDERGRLVVATSTRALAVRLHVAKDTATKIVALLVRCGYLRRRVQPRDAGRFAPGRYTLRPPAGFQVTHAGEGSPCPAAPPAVPRRSRRRSRGRQREADQLGLFATSAEPPGPGDRR